MLNYKIGIINDEKYNSLMVNNIKCGLEKYNINLYKIKSTNDLLNCKLVICIRGIKKADNKLKLLLEKLVFENKIKVIFIENCPIIKSYFITINNIKNFGTINKINYLSDRWQKFNIQQKKFNNKGNYVLIFGQLEDYASCKNIKIYKLFKKAIEELKKHNYKNILFKSHPKILYNQHKFEKKFCIDLNIKYDDKYSKTIKNLEKNHVYKLDLLNKYISKAIFCVTINSWAGVQALFQGKQVYTLHESFIGYEISNKKLPIENININNYNQWCYNFAYKCYTPTEIKEGIWWPIYENSGLLY